MQIDTYRVIKEIPDGWETSAQVGDILTWKWWEGGPTLMKGDKAVCDQDSKYGREHCIKEDTDHADRG